MVIYELECIMGHRFEGWFKDAAAFDKQHANRLINCSKCGIGEVIRVPAGGHVVSSAPKVAKDNRRAVKKSDDEKTTTLDAVTLLKAVHHFIGENFRDVGGGFADEARRIHKGEKPAEPIRGRVLPEESERLREEGINCLMIPELPDAMKN